MYQVRVIPRLVVACLGFLPLGCTLYQPRPVTFTVRDAETKQPIEGAQVETSYRVMLDFGVLFGSVGPMSGKTDQNGQLTLIVDPDKPMFTMSVDAVGYSVASNERPSGMYAIKYLSRRWYQWSEECEINLYHGPQASAELLLPAGYRGPVVVYFSPTDVPPAQVGQREFTFTVSAQGGVSIPQSGLLESPGSYAYIKARYPGTAPLTTVTEYPKLHNDIPTGSADKVALRFVEVDWEKHARIYVVGTHAEAIALNNQVWPDDDHEDKAAFARILADHPRPEPVPTQR
jgi:hypothetical protein